MAIIIKCKGDTEQYNYYNIKDIPKELNDKIVYLSCSFNQLNSLPEYPNLEYLYCYNNILTSLPEYPNLKELYCSYNKLTSLPEYPNLEKLYCSFNRITSLPEYPNLQILSCSNNKLFSLSEYSNLETLYCSNNQLTKLPNIHTWNNLQYIAYHDNPIENIHPRISRFLENLERLRNNEYEEDHNIIYNDRQNVHNNIVQQSIKESIEALLDQEFQ
jgi:Leucine-rich repeat (LRR) protein